MGNGSRANRTGNRAEQAIRDLLEMHEYKEVQSNLFCDECKALKRPIYAHQVHVGQNIYGKKRICDFIVYHPERHPNCLVIESKWQASSGSVDEKYPFLVLSIQQSKYDSIIVLDGRGYSPGAEKWIKEQVGNRLKAVLDIGGFQRWSKKNL